MSMAQNPVVIARRGVGVDIALTIAGTDISGWRIAGEATIAGTSYTFPGWVTDGPAGKATLHIPLDVVKAFEGRIEKACVIGTPPVGAEERILDLVLNGLEQP